MYSFDLKLAWEIVVTIFALAGNAIAWIALRSKNEGVSEESARNTSQKISNLETATRKHDGQIEEIKSHLATVPTREDLRLISVEVGNVRTQVAEVSGQLRGVSRALDLINEHLLSRSTS